MREEREQWRPGMLATKEINNERSALRIVTVSQVEEKTWLSGVMDDWKYCPRVDAHGWAPVLEDPATAGLIAHRMTSAQEQDLREHIVDIFVCMGGPDCNGWNSPEDVWDLARLCLMILGADPSWDEGQLYSWAFGKETPLDIWTSLSSTWARSHARSSSEH